jgi:receptor protein-tyrosine kinase
MGELIVELREVADFVIVGTAPILLVADALSLAPLVEGVLFVADSEVTTRGAVSHAREQLEQVGAPILGAVFNNFDPSKARGYYPYYGYYPYRYRYGRYGYGERYGYGYYGGTPTNGRGKDDDREAARLLNEAPPRERR